MNSTYTGPLTTGYRNPYPFPAYENDDTFNRSRSYEKLPYAIPTRNAQKSDPWNRLYHSCTLQSARREAAYFDPEEPRDDLDFVLKGQYNHHAETLKPKNKVMVQKETLGTNPRRILKNRVKYVPTEPPPLNHPIHKWEQHKQLNINSVHHHQAIEGHHSETTNRGYARKPDGGGVYAI